MIIKDFPAFAFPPLRDCARCGRTVQADEGGVPCDPEHPFYNRWICDDCLDQIGDLIEEGEKGDIKMTCGEIALMLNNIMESAEIMPDYICNDENYEEGKTVVLNGVTLYGLEYALKKAIEKLMEVKEDDKR